MELEQPNTPVQVNDPVHYYRGGYYVRNATSWFHPKSTSGGLIRATRHRARVRLMRQADLTRRQAEAKLDEIKDYYVSHPDAAFEIKRRHVKDSTNVSLTEDEVTEIALHGWRRHRERYNKLWRTGQLPIQMTEDT